jgi:phenylpyruvate tautomerase PptA (4-oxalocrotonate tautomerase family)
VAHITRSLVVVLGKPPEHTHVVIDEVDPRDRGFAGLLTSELRRRESGAARRSGRARRRRA